MQRTSFDADWEYSVHAGMSVPPGAEWTPVHLPHDVSIERPRSAAHPTGGGGGYAWSGLVTYRKVFHVLESWRGKSVQLEFEGVYMNAEVTLNSDLLARHPYGYTGFLVDLAGGLKYGQDNVLSVLVNNSAQPNSRWYTGTGIYRPVWLHVGEGAHIEPWGLYATTAELSSESARVRVSAETAGLAGSEAHLRIRILDADGEPVAQTEAPVDARAGLAEQELRVPRPRPWSLGDPYLYRLNAELVVDGRVCDEATIPLGIRTISVDARHGFRLNGSTIKLKGGCVHHDNGLLGAASYARAEERKVELLLAAGYNAIRCAHNPPAPALLDACDRLGMLVIDETFDCWRTGKNPNDYHLYFEEWWARDTASMVRRDLNHPAVIMWSIGNEVPERAGVSDGYVWAQRQADFVRSLDGTRPVTSALPFLFEAVFQDALTAPESVTDAQSMFDPARLIPADEESEVWGRLTAPFCRALDVVGYNYLYPRYDHDSRRFPDRVMAGTETFPAMAYATWRATEALPQVIGDFVWTAIDYLGESGIGRVSYEPGSGFGAPYPYHLANCGDIDICGFKRAPSFYRDVLWGVQTGPCILVLDPVDHGRPLHSSPWSWEPVTESWTFPGKEGRATRVDVYSADDEVELILNGRSLGRTEAGAAGENVARFDVIYEPGTLEAIAYRDGAESGRAFLRTAGPPAALQLHPDRNVLEPAYGDLSYVTVTVVDAEGSRVPWADDAVYIEVSGPGDLVAMGTADPFSEEPYVGPTRHAYEGRLMCVVRTTGEPGAITVSASAGSLAAASAVLQVHALT